MSWKLKKMIEEIRKKLILKYTIFFTVILLLCFSGSYIAYRVNIVNFINAGLSDYLSEEVWEAQEFASSKNQPVKINRINADINSLQNLTYWFIDGRLIHAEIPKNEKIAAELLNRLGSKHYQENRIFHENIKIDGQKWYFTLLKQSFSLSDGSKADIFVLANYSPIRKNAKTYVKTAVISLILLTVLAFIIGHLLAARPMKHIETMYRKQKQFVSDAAHELRTPLSILLSYAELLEYKPNETKIVTDIKEQILQTNELLDTLLTIARYDNDDIMPKKEKFDLNALAATTAEHFGNLYKKDLVKLRLHGKKALISADSGMLRQLLYILLDNAVKYTPDDKKISLDIAAGKNDVSITVSDNGIGIAKEDIPCIFDRFWQADKSRNSQGLGLGLYLADMIVRRHKGHITVDSHIGKGTTFKITLPKQNI